MVQRWRFQLIDVKPIVFLFLNVLKYKGRKVKKMKKLIIAFVLVIAGVFSANAYQVMSSKELGKNDAKNQNVVVKCTTDLGKLSNKTCSLRRYVKCSGTGINKKCNGWQGWRDLRNPEKQYSDWKTAANECCRTMGLR